ncbi:hypothetical protein LCGC14_1617560, partial [marine sediment metagenome]
GVATLLLAAPVLAAGLAISPPTVEFDVPADGSAEVEFLVYDFTGDLEISLEDIPLRVEPTTVPVTAKEEGTKVVLAFYGDESLGAQVFNGKIRFLALTGGTVAMGIKVRATINHIAAGPLEEAPAPTEESMPEEAPIPAEQAPAPPTPAPATSLPVPPVPAPERATEFPIVPVAGIAAGLAIVITLIVVFGRRLRH